MNIDCSVIRDLLPLYADDVCSDGSRRLIEEHLPECPECSAVLKQLQSREIEENLLEEKGQVIEYQAKRFKRRSAAVGSVIAGIFTIPVVVCLIVSIVTGGTKDWFFIMLGGLAVAASLIIVPLMVPRDKLFWTFTAFCASLVVLLLLIWVSTGGTWFFPAVSASLFGLSLIFLPFVLRAAPVRPLIGDFNRWLIVISVDVILFANMMNMITLFTKNVFSTILLGVFCVAGGWMLVSAINAKRSESK